MSTPGPGRDPGLQTERTALAVRRTVLAATGGTAVVTLTAQRSGYDVVVLLAAVLAVTLAAAVLRHSRLPPAERAAPWSVLVMAVGTVFALAALGLASATASILGRSS